MSITRNDTKADKFPNPFSIQVIREIYRNTVVQVGFYDDYIMQGVLALSDLHLAHHCQPMRDHYLAAAIRHHQAASQAAIPPMLDATTGNAQMLFLFSALTIHYGTPSRFHSLHAHPDTNPLA